MLLWPQIGVGFKWLLDRIVVPAGHSFVHQKMTEFVTLKKDGKLLYRGTRDGVPLNLQPALKELEGKLHEVSRDMEKLLKELESHEQRDQ